MKKLDYNAQRFYTFKLFNAMKISTSFHTHAGAQTRATIILAIVSLSALLLSGCGGSAVPQDATPDTSSQQQTQQQTQQTVATAPADGWTLHMTAKKLFPGNTDMTVHKYCKSVVGNMTQCQLYDGNDSDSRLVGVETIVGPEMYNTFTPDEKKLWMPTKDLLQTTMAAMPDLDPQQFNNVAQSLSSNYSKVYLMWDPGKINLPTGSPMVTVMNTTVATGTTATATTPQNSPSNTDKNPGPSASAQPATTPNPADKNGFTFGAYDTTKLMAAGLSDIKGNFEDSILQRNSSGSLELYKLKGNIGLHTYANTTQFVYILSGKGEFTVGDKKQAVSSGMVVIIPAGVAQAFQNLDDKTHPLVFVTFKTPFDDSNVKWQ